MLEVERYKLMGFIDYQGTKENRYDDVLEFAKAQQEEEFRRLEDARVNKWVSEILKDGRYVGLELSDLIKYIIVRYRKLVELKESLMKCDEEETIIDNKLLWNDFCIALVTKRLEPYGLEEEKQETYYHTMLGKAFKVEDFTDAKTHYGSIRDNPNYKRYFADCFDLVQERQFWKWLGRVGDKERLILVEFVTIYEQLSVLLGYYFFQGTRPQDSEWMRRLDLEHQVLEKISTDYSKGCFREPNLGKLQNPLYESVKPKRTVKEIVEEMRKSRLDRNVFENLLQKQQLLDYAEACRLLISCELPENMENLFKELIARMPILQESIDKFESVYQPDMYQFYEYYIPEALRLTATYIEYLDVGIGEKILKETEIEVLDATSKLLTGINDKVDEIYRFASMEIKAKAKALESIMSQDGHVDSKYKIN